MKPIRLIFTFYKNFAAVSSILTMACLFLLSSKGIAAIGVLFWFKVITLGIIFFFVNQYKKDEVYYYSNLGFSRKKLWIYAIAIDLGLYILANIIITSRL